MNKKIILILTILVFLSFFLTSSRASDIEIIASEKATTVYTGQIVEIEILIKNKGNSKDTFYFSIWPTYWVTLQNYWISLMPDEVTTVSLTIQPPKYAEEGFHVFKFEVRSVDTNASGTQEIYFDIKRITNVYVSEIKLNKQSLKPDEKLTIQPMITSIEKLENVKVFVTTKIIKDGSVVKLFDKSLIVKPKSTETLSYEFDVKMDHSPGNYVVDVFIKDNINKVLDEGKINFEIESIHDIGQYKEIKNNLLYSSVTITVTNNGNSPESVVHVTETLPEISAKFFYPETEPTSEEIKDNRVVYTWSMYDLNPGETRTVIYQLRFVNVVIISGILFAAIIWIIWLFFRPKLMKNYIGLLGKEKEVTISLQFKNKGRKILDKVIVKDFVPALAKVITKFDTIPPTIKRKSTGTELTWIIKHVKPRDERILTYKIKPIVDIIGELKLPKAHLFYETKKGKRRRVLSKTVTITGKVK